MTHQDRIATTVGWSDVEPIFEAALDLSEAARPAFLAQACGENHELRREVTALLDAHRRSGPLDDPLPFALGVMLREPWPPPVEGADAIAPLAGVTLGGYTLERQLGRGGMGAVWLARRSDGRFEGRVAIKLLNLALSTATGQERFRREGSMLARLAHPGVARLLDAGVSPTGQPYLVLEYVDGERIDDFADAHALTAEDRIRLFLQVIWAVGHAHANLIVHRDLKPSNILVTPDGTVKLLDFGIAKLLDAEGGTDRSALTADGGRPLTPEFAAPEQVLGAPITTATDVYSLGVLLYLLIAGRHPTLGDRAARTVAETLHGLLEVDPEPLGRSDLDAILAKALRKAPRERYQTVAAFAEDLERYLRREPVRARPDSLAYRASRFVRRNRAGVLAVSVTFAALVGATGFSLDQMRRAEGQRDVAVQEKHRAEALRDFQHLMMSRLAERPFTMRELLDEGRTIVEREHVGDPTFLSVILVDIASRYGELDEPKLGGVLLARAESLAVAGYGRDKLAEIRCHIGENLRHQARYDDARRALEGGEAILRARPDPYAEIVCLATRSELEAATDRPQLAEQAVRRAMTIYDSLGEHRHLRYVKLLNTLAGSYESQRRFREGLAVNRQTIALVDSLGRGNTSSSAILRHNLGTTLTNLGEIAEAERVLQDVLTRFARSDPSGRLGLIPIASYAQAAAFNEHIDSSIKYYRLLTDRAIEEGDSTFLARGLYGLTRAYAKRGDLAEARRLLGEFRASAARSPRFQIDDAQLAGWIAKGARDDAATYDHFVRALRLTGYFEGKRLLGQRVPLVRSAEAAIALGRASEALAFLAVADSMTAFDTLAEARSAYLGEVRLMRARALLASGDTAAAGPLLEKARVALRTGAGETNPLTREADVLAARVRR
jgi:eukaryotic-like serine/threonine-protein kinase